MDPEMSESVIKVFGHLHEKGLIYRGVRMINWDPAAGTALSDEEVIHRETQGKLYYLRYYIDNSADTDIRQRGADDALTEGGSEGAYSDVCDRASDEEVRQVRRDHEYLVVATTRPETILGDVAVCVNPNDPRYTALKGKRVIVPLVNRSVPIIYDDYVTMDFGTGALKITPAHDVND
jgi:valyl-tRNA synthetase